MYVCASGCPRVATASTISLQAVAQNQAPENGVASAAQVCDMHGSPPHAQLRPCSISWSAMHIELAARLHLCENRLAAVEHTVSRRRHKTGKERHFLARRELAGPRRIQPRMMLMRWVRRGTRHGMPLACPKTGQKRMMMWPQI
jgi:hypothetical protein